MNEKLVSVVVVDYHGGDVLEKCLQSIFLSTYPALEVIVVDNANDERTAEVSKKFGVVRLVSGRNLQYSGGNNFGAKSANGEYILFLNNDATLHRDAISRLVEEANRTNATLFAPKILLMDHPQMINSAGIQMHMAGFGILRGCGEEDKGQYDKQKETCAPHGACFLISKSSFHKLRCFDESFFAFYEDSDLGWKNSLMGKSTTYVPSAIVYHKWGHSWNKANKGSKMFLAERNRLTLILTNYQRRTMILLLPIFILAEGSTIAYCAFQGILGCKIKGYSDLILLRYYIMRRRRLIQSIRTTNDDIIVKSFTLEYKHSQIGKSNLTVNVLFHFFGDFLKRFIR